MQPIASQNPAVLQMVNALKGIPAIQPAAPVQNYAAPVPNLNPNLAKAAARVQQVATGQPKPTAATWG